MVVGTRGSASAADGRLKDFRLPSVFRGEKESYLSFRHWRFQVETFFDLKNLREVLDNPGEAAVAERRYVAAVFSRVLEGPALDIALSSSKEGAPHEVWAVLRERYDPPSHEPADSIWARSYRRKLLMSESLTNWLESEFSEIREITGVPPSDEEKRRLPRKIMGEKEEYRKFLYYSYKDRNITWNSPCRDQEGLYKTRQSRSVRSEKPEKAEKAEKADITPVIRKNTKNTSDRSSWS